MKFRDSDSAIQPNASRIIHPLQSGPESPVPQFELVVGRVVGDEPAGVVVEGGVVVGMPKSKAPRRRA